MVRTGSPALHQANVAVQTWSCLNTAHHRAHCTDMVPFNLLCSPAGWYQHAHFSDEQTDTYKASQRRRQDPVPGWPDSKTESLTSELCPRGHGDGGGAPPHTWMDAFPGWWALSQRCWDSHDCSSCSQIRRAGGDFSKNPSASAPPFPLGDPSRPPHNLTQWVWL